MLISSNFASKTRYSTFVLGPKMNQAAPDTAHANFEVLPMEILILG